MRTMSFSELTSPMLAARSADLDRQPPLVPMSYETGSWNRFHTSRTDARRSSGGYWPWPIDSAGDGAGTRQFGAPLLSIEELQHRGEGGDAGRGSRLDPELDVGDALVRVGTQGGGQLLRRAPERLG